MPTPSNRVTPHAGRQPLVYVCVMSQFSLPNLEACLTRAPTDLVLVVSDFAPAHDAASRLATVLETRLPGLHIHRPDQHNVSVSLSGDDPLDNQRWIDEVLRPYLTAPSLANKPHWLNLTGGTKALSLALLTGIQWDGLDYKPHGANALHHFQLAWPDTNRSLPALTEATGQEIKTPLIEVDALDVAKLYNSHVVVPTPSAGTLPTAALNTLAEQLYASLMAKEISLLALFRLLEHVWCHERDNLAFKEDIVTLSWADAGALMKHPQDEGVKAWLKTFHLLAPEAFAFDDDQVTLPGNGKLNAKKYRLVKQLRRWLSGQWLENLLYLWLKEAGVPDSAVALNAQGGSSADNSSEQREADLLVHYHSRTSVIEVKADIPPGKSIADLETQLTSLQSRFGSATLIFFAGPQLRQRLEDQWAHVEARFRAANAKVCTTRVELLAALKLTQAADAPAAIPAAAATQPHANDTVPQPAPARKPSSVQTSRPAKADAELKDLCHKAFLRAAWGEDDAERRSDIEQFRQAVLAIDPLEGAARFETALRQGRHGHELWHQLKRKLEQLGDGEAIKAWLENTELHSSERSFKHVTLELKKWREHQQRRKQSARNTQGPKAYRSTLTPVILDANGQHPNSVTALTPSPHWEVLIDETGKDFDSTEIQAPVSDPALGRLVAIVKAQNATLPLLSRDFHGTKETPDAVDRAFEQLLSTPQVGIFGFTIKDPIAYGAYWMNHVGQLVRWVLYMLPVEEDQPTRVDVSIEQRSGYIPNNDRLEALSQTLEGEFRALDPKRFAGLSLRLRIVAKQHPYLAYADAVAYTWGSPAAVNDDRMKKSKLLGPCLMHPHAGQSLWHLYQALSHHGQLPAAQWYDLCHAAEREGPQSLLARWLEKFGQQIRQQRTQWQSLLKEVQQRMRAKGMSLLALSAALAWLERFMPDDAQFSGELALRFISARLALANHYGQVDRAALGELLPLSRKLEDENAPEVCQALLRATITTTNHFEFGAMEGILTEWTHKPMAVPGRLNHAKLHSTLGQLAAFQQRNTNADQHFTQALEALMPLSDPRQAARERTQTRTYQLMVQLDDGSRCASEKRDSLEAFLTDVTGRQNLCAVARRFAAAGGGPEVYLHHLLLRACLALPESLADVAQAYLDQAHAWQWHDSHPWGLIQAYRGWLLIRQPGTDHHPLANTHFHAALETCWASTHGITLHWMGAVLHALFTSLLTGFTAEIPPYGERKTLQQSLPQAPHTPLEELAALPNDASHAQLWSLLSQCLPFNFH